MFKRNKLAILVLGVVLVTTLSALPARSKMGQPKYQILVGSNLVGINQKNTHEAKEESNCAKNEQLHTIEEGPDEGKKVCCKKGKTFWEWVSGQEGTIIKCDLSSSG